MTLPKYKRNRIRRLLAYGNWPFRHFDRDDMKKLFPEEYKSLCIVYAKLKEKSVELGVEGGLE